MRRSLRRPPVEVFRFALRDQLLLVLWLREERLCLLQGSIDDRFVDAMVLHVEEAGIGGCVSDLFREGFPSSCIAIQGRKIDERDLISVAFARGCC